MPLEIKKNGNYSNVVLKTKYKRQGRNLVLEDGKPVIQHQGLEPGESTILEKVDFAEGRLMPGGQFGPSYSCTAIYDGEKVSFFLKEYEHEQWKVCGGVGDKVKVSAETAYMSTGAAYVKLKFEKQ